MNESEKQFSFTRAALSTRRRAKTKFLSVGLFLENATGKCAVKGIRTLRP